MKASGFSEIERAGRVVWTRDLARDLFPGPATPFAWTLLAGPAENALRSHYADLGAPVPADEPFWRLDHGYVYLNAQLVSAADEKLCGGAWLGRQAPAARGGLFGRMQAGGVIKRAQGRLAGAAGEAGGLRTRLLRWSAWTQGLRWTQADVLQVMEELEPHAVTALQVYFLTRAALNAADAQLQSRLDEWLPRLSLPMRGALCGGIEELPSAEAALAITAAARLPASSPERLAALARYGHRGPGEMRPDASRWLDAPALLDHLSEAGLERRLADAQRARRDAEAAARAQLSGGQVRQLDELLSRLRQAMVAADAAWDALIAVMAAAQRWSAAAAREALLAGLIARPADVLFLELEELKQVATGEWHGGRSAEVQAEVAQRMAAPAQLAETADAIPVEVVAGGCEGPVYADSPACIPPPARAVWLAETLDPGCLPFWADACELRATGHDPWTPGMIAARALGAPAVAGAG